MSQFCRMSRRMLCYLALLLVAWKGMESPSLGQNPGDAEYARAMAEYRQALAERKELEESHRWVEIGIYGLVIVILLIAVVIVLRWTRKIYAEYKAYMERDAVQTQRIIQLLESIERKMQERGV